MDLLNNHRRTIGRLAWVMAWVALVVGQLHALSRHATADGRSDLELATTRFWAEPAADALRPLLDWGDPDLVYVTYGKLWLPVFAAFFLCALVVRRLRRPTGFERGVWTTMCVVYGLAVLGVAAEYWTQWTGTTTALLEIVFVAILPVVLATLVGSTVLGITLLRKGFRPLLPAWLLALTFPLALVIAQLTSLGNVVLPVAFAFGLLGRRLAATGAASDLAAPQPVGTR